MKRFVSMLLVVVMCITCVPMTVNAQRDISREEILAQELKDLGLFRGVSETDFDLNRAPSRVEALVMLIRVLGKEHEVTSDTWKHPFTDVPSWADNYVGYAYSKGLTNGQTATQFGTGDANAAMYLTFVLRALGYSDTNGKDFAWDNPYTLSRETGILDNSVNINEFWRADVVIVSHKALSSYLNGSQQTLAQKLISAGVFTQREFDSIYNNGINVTKPTQSGELTAEEIFSKCSPAVFYIELYDKYDEAISSGSGFFIDDKGTAVTNYHVIEDAYSALIQLSDTEAVHEVLGVYDYNAEEDWAIIKIDCSGNKYLNIGDNSSVVGGAKVYAIGSPLGLQNTISEGIVSNPARVYGGVTYIQTNAAISNGSSGGALLNKYGEVIGITSAGYTEGQNLNLALPMSYLPNNYNQANLVDLSSLIIMENNVYDNNIWYDVSEDSVSLNVGEIEYVSFDYTCIGFPDEVTITVETENENIATAVWADMDDIDLPWDIEIEGISPGTTFLIITNDFNDEYKTIRIDVKKITNGSSNSQYDLLADWICENATDETDEQMIFYDESHSGTLYSISYDFEDDGITIAQLEESDKSTLWAAFTIKESASHYDCGIIYAWNSTDEIVAEAYGKINAKTYVFGTDLYYSDYFGEDGLEDNIESLYHSSIVLNIEWLRVLLDRIDIGVTMDGLGFINYT